MNPITIERAAGLHKTLKSDLKTWHATKFEQETFTTELHSAVTSINDKIASLHDSVASTNAAVANNHKSVLALCHTIEPPEGQHHDRSSPDTTIMECL